MRIIAGMYRGRTLAPVRETGVRPATDRVKGAIFNVLQNRLRIHGALVLDLFAGTGSLGFEALSRGAGRVVFVDSGSPLLETLEANAGRLGCEEACEMIIADALAYVQSEPGSFDLIFADPPYEYRDTPLIPGLIAKHQLLKNEGFLIIEHARRTSFEPAPPLEPVVRKEFGNTHVTFFAQKQ